MSMHFTCFPATTNSTRLTSPPHIRFFDTRRHDSVSGIITLAEFRKINPDLQIKNLCLDSAHDNYPTYELCKKWDIMPFIDLNSNRGEPETIPKRLDIDTDGIDGRRLPVYSTFCSGGYYVSFSMDV